MTLISSWTRQLRYAPYSTWSANYRTELATIVQKSPYRLNYHVQPDTGLLNDPNGFSYFNHQWHLFYQSYPMGPVHGLKSWQHLISDDLIHWKSSTPLLPDNTIDSHGVYSGSAFPIKDQLFLFYTGNIRASNWERKSFQNGAWLSKDGIINKITHPLINQPKQYTEHFRDPMIFKYANQFWALVGAQNKNIFGKIAVFKAHENNVENWLPAGELDFSKESMGYMIECPNLVFIQEQPILIFCPQGLSSKLTHYQNLYPNTYVVGKSFEPETLTITQPSPLNNLDEGFDIYATQAFNAPDGRALSISWLGLPDTKYPTDKEGWAHCLSLVKELTLHAGKLYQYPVRETKQLRQVKQSLTLSEKGSIQTTNSYELELIIPTGTKKIVHLFGDNLKSTSLVLTIDALNGKIIMDRSNAGVAFNSDYGQTRISDVKAHQKISINIFVDKSTVEVYINHGEKVMSSRLFPSKNQNSIWSDSTLDGTMWPLSKVNVN